MKFKWWVVGAGRMIGQGRYLHLGPLVLNLFRWDEKSVWLECFFTFTGNNLLFVLKFPIKYTVAA